MKIIYRACDITEAHIVAGMLEANGIDNHVGGYYLQGGVGDLAAMDFVTISVAEENIDAANALVAEYESKNKPANKSDSENSNGFSLPLIVVIVCVLMILFAAVVSGN